MIRVDTFIDLPKKAFTKNAIQNHIFPGDAVLWACPDGESRKSRSSDTGWRPGSETPQALTPGSAGVTNTSARTQGLGWEGGLERSIVSRPGEEPPPCPPEAGPIRHRKGRSCGVKE